MQQRDGFKGDAIAMVLRSSVGGRGLLRGWMQGRGGRDARAVPVAQLTCGSMSFCEADLCGLKARWQGGRTAP
jgi:hypothetical protein